MRFGLERPRWVRSRKIRGFLARTRRDAGVRPFSVRIYPEGEHTSSSRNPNHLILKPPAQPALKSLPKTLGLSSSSAGVSFRDSHGGGGYDNSSPIISY